MAIIRCKMCGGDIELSEDKTFGTCDCCGSTMTFPKVSDDQRAAAFNRGNHFRRIGEFDKALAVYERIVQEDDTDAEAHWCCALCRFGIEYVEDPGTFEYMPTCHRASFDSILEDVDYLAALEHSDGITRRQYQKDAAKIAEVQKGILATSQNEEPFDVFICYKESDANGGRTKDSLLAQEIYYQLTDQGRRVFFSRITLEDKVGSQYEPYIFAALNSAKVMIVVGTKEEYLNAVWVKNEWSRFLALMKKDRTKLLLPCYRDMDPYDLPEQLSVLQSYDMSKIGFIQDLTRGISKVLDADKKPVATETVVVTGGNDNTAALLKRGNMALEDGDWKKADEFFEQVLNQNAESAEAYMGKFLVSKQAAMFGKWAEKYLAQTSHAEVRTREAVEADGNREAKIVNDYALQGYLAKEELKKLLEFDRTYASQLFERTKQCNQANMIFDQDKSLVRAFRFASGAFANDINGVKQNLIDTMNQRCEESREKDEEKAKSVAEAYKKHLDDAEVKAKELREQAEAKREGDYMQQVEWFEAAATIDDYKRVQSGFKKLGAYKDCAEYVQKCEDAIGRLKMEAADKAARLKAEQEAEEARLQAELAAEEERKRIIAAKEAAAKKKKMTTMGIIAAAIFVVIIAAVLVVTKVVIPGNKYKEAEQLLASGENAKAAMAFGSIIDYKDAKERSFELWDGIARRTTFAAGGSNTVGEGHVAAITKDGNVLHGGDLADESTDAYTDIVSLSADESGFYALYLKADGTVSRSGLRVTTNNIDWNDIVDVSFYYDGKSSGSYGLKADGTVCTNDETFPGVEYWTDIIDIAVANDFMVGLKADGTVVTTGSISDFRYYENAPIEEWCDVIDIAADYGAMMGLKADGTVYVAGNDYYGLSSEVATWTDIVAISTQRGIAAGLRKDGTVLVAGNTGDNDKGQGDAEFWTNVVAIDVGNFFVAGLQADGTVLIAGAASIESGELVWPDVKVTLDVDEMAANAVAYSADVEFIVESAFNALNNGESEAVLSEILQNIPDAYLEQNPEKSYELAYLLEVQMYDELALRCFTLCGDYEDAARWTEYVAFMIELGNRSDMPLEEFLERLGAFNDLFVGMDLSWYETIAECAGRYDCYWKTEKNGKKDEGTDKDINYHINLSFYLENGTLKCKFENSLFHDTKIYDAYVTESNFPEHYSFMSKHQNSDNGVEYVYYSPDEAFFKGDTFGNQYYYKKAE